MKYLAEFIYDGIAYRLFDNLYAVSQCGKVLRNMRPVTLKPRNDGYVTAGRRRLLHRVVATCWLERPEGANHVHHINGDKADNRAENLAWLTPKQHIADHHSHTAGVYERTPEIRQKLRDFRTGLKTSEETKQKQREASIRAGCKPPARPVGYKVPPEIVEKTRLKLMQPCTVLGIEYPSFLDASIATGIKRGTIRKRCISKNFPEYFLRNK